MVRNYNLSQRLLAYLLVLSLFLQSCGNVPNQIKPMVDELGSGRPGSSKQVDIQQLLEQDFTAEKGYIVTFYEDNEDLKADVKVDAPQSPIYKGLPVTIEEGTEIAELHHLDLQTQQQRIQLRQPKNGQSGRVLILKGGLLGGMLEGDDYEEKEKEKEAEKVKLDDKELKELLAYAQSGNREAQFALGERCYEAWQQHYKEKDLQEAKKWLEKAANQGHQVAITLLAEVNLPPLVEDSKAIKYTRKGKEKEFNPNTPPILTTKSTFNKQNQIYLPPISNAVLQEDSQQQELKRRIIAQLAQPAYYQHIKLELHNHLLSPNLSQKQNKTLSELITMITAPEKKLRLGGSHEIREDFRANPAREHNLFEPLRVHLQKLAGYKQEFLDTPIESLLEELIEKHQAFIANLTEQVKNLGPTAPLKLFEAKPVVQGEGFDCYEVRTKKAYQLACYNLHEYEYVRSNSSGLSIGSMHGGVYFKVDNGTGLLRPAKEHAVYSFYQALGLADLLSPTHLLIMNGLSVLPPDIGESPERRELSQKKQELQTPSTQKVFNHYPELEQKLKVAQKERSLFIQGSLVVPGKTLEKFLEEAEKSPNPDSIIQRLEPASFSGHVLASLLLLPTDYKADNLMVDEQNRIIGIDNDAALEAAELRRLNSSNKHAISIKNILYLLPLMQSAIAATIQRQFIEVHPGLFLLNWLMRLQDKQLYYDYLLNASLVDYENPTQIKKNAERSLELPLQFVSGWIAGIYERFAKIQTILKNNSSTTHQELFEQIHPFASRYYNAVKKLFSHPLDQIAFIYEKTPKDFDSAISNTLEDLVAQYPALGDEELLHNLAQSSFIKQDPSLSIGQTIQELIASIDLKNYNASEQLSYIERVVEIGIWPDRLHDSWYDPLLLIHMVAEGASDLMIKALIENAKADIHARNASGKTILHAAVRRGGQDALRQIPLLIQLGADKESQGQYGVTPLDLSAEKADLDIFKLLIDLGAGEKTIYNKINNFYKKLSDREKKELIPYITKFTQVHPKAGWKISLDEIFPTQGEAKGILRTVTEGDRVISEEAWDKLFEKDGKPKKANAYGVRSVPFLEKYNQRIYLKFFPQLPGTELAVIRLAENLLGYCAPYCELASINGIPVLLTQGVPGETLYEALKNHPEKLNQLDPESVSKALILAMLINPGDGNLGNYILSPFTNPEGEERYRLISIDNDQAFIPAVAKTIKTGMFSTTLSLQVKTVLYCLEAIKQQTNQAVINKVKNADLLKILEAWLSSLKLHHEAARNHFDSNLLKKYQQAKTTVVGVAFAPGMIKRLFTKLMRLQTALNKKKAPLHFELLETLEPFVAHRYRTIIMDTRLNSIEKFKRAENVTEEQALTSSSNALPQLLISREIPEVENLQAVLWSGNYGPNQALKELQEVKQEHTNLDQVLKALGQLSTQTLRRSTTGIIEKLLQGAELTKLSFLQQKALLEAIKGQELSYVNLKNCNALSNSLLASFNLEHIKKLDVSGCPNLGTISSGLFGVFPLIMPTLTHFRLDESGVSGIRLQATQLKKLHVRNCPKLRNIELIAPELHKLDLRGAIDLPEKVIRSLFEQFPNTFIYLTPTPVFSQKVCTNYLNERGLGYLANNEYNLAAHYLKQSADQGNTTAHSPLTNFALKGNKAAQSWVIKQAEKGNNEAKDTLYKLGSIYEKGTGVEKDENKAVEWYIKAANQGHNQAKFTLVNSALQGNKLANQWVIDQAERGDSQSQYAVAKIYKNGIGIIKDEGKAAEWYIKAANQGHKNASSNVSILALKDIKPAQKWVIEQAERDDSQSQYALAEIYKNGIGIRKDEGKAAEWYIKAANQGDKPAEAALTKLALKGSKVAQEWLIDQAEKANNKAIEILYELGRKYEEGREVEKNEKKAVKFYVKAANQGHNKASSNISILALKDIKPAQKWVIEQAKKGHILAHVLGKMYENGIGVEKNECKAAEWYIKAANQGDKRAKAALTKLALKESKVAQEWLIDQAKKGNNKAIEILYELGRKYEEGREVEKNEKKAVEWYVEAANQGHKRTQAALIKLALKGSKVVQEWLIDQADKDNSKAIEILYELGRNYEEGRDVEQDEKKAVEWYIKSDSQGHNKALVALIELALKGNKFPRNWIIEQAKKGHILAHVLGKMYENGIGVEKNECKAAEWYIKAANQGDKRAEAALTKLALKGSKVAQEWLIDQAEKANKKAIKWYIKADNLGYNEASFNIIILAVKGIKRAQQWIIEELKRGGEISQGILNLTSSYIGDSEAIKLAEILPNTQIHTLDLSSNKIGASGAIKLAEALSNTQIHTLDLRDNEIGNLGAIKLSETLPNTQIHALDLRYNKIGDLGAIKLSEALPSSQIHTLELGYNEIGDSGAIKLSETLPNTQIHTLHLSSNQIGDSGAIKLSEALPNSQIHTLDLSRNQIGDSGAMKLAEALPNTAIHTLKLWDNQIGTKMKLLLRQQNPKINFRF